MEQLSIDDPIFALATPWGESAIAVLRVSGEASLTLLDRCFRGKHALSETRSHTVRHGTLVDPDTDSVIDEVMAAVYKTPTSYTGENGAELFTHGSPAIISAVMELLLRSGFRQASPGEFTQRAFLNGKVDLTRAEAVNDLIRARSDRARSLAMNRLSGAVENRVNALKEAIADLLASVEILIDYPEEDITVEAGTWRSSLAQIEEQVARLLGTYTTGRIIQEGISIVIAGGTNAGKSTLFNLILREDRAIVSDVHGTTRDYLEGAACIRGVPVRLFDTAGIRRTDDVLEVEGIKRSDRMIANADLILLVVDGVTGLSEDDCALLEKYKGRPLLGIWNKTDRSSLPCPQEFIPMSSLTGSGIELLEQKIDELFLDEGSVGTGEPVIDSVRQKLLLEECASHLAVFRNALDKELPLDLLAVDLKSAMDSLGEITGAITTEDMLQRMFSTFCVGK